MTDYSTGANADAPTTATVRRTEPAWPTADQMRAGMNGQVDDFAKFCIDTCIRAFMEWRLDNERVPAFPRITRLTVVETDGGGVAYERYGVTVSPSIQDSGATLKLFVTDLPAAERDEVMRKVAQGWRATVNRHLDPEWLARVEAPAPALVLPLPRLRLTPRPNPHVTYYKGVTAIWDEWARAVKR